MLKTFLYEKIKANPNIEVYMNYPLFMKRQK